MKDKARDTWGKPNLAEWFLYHTRLGRFYASLNRTEHDVVRVLVLLGSICLGVLIYIAWALFN